MLMSRMVSDRLVECRGLVRSGKADWKMMKLTSDSKNQEIRDQFSNTAERACYVRGFPAFYARTDGYYDVLVKYRERKEPRHETFNCGCRKCQAKAQAFIDSQKS